MSPILALICDVTVNMTHSNWQVARDGTIRRVTSRRVEKYLAEPVVTRLLHEGGTGNQSTLVPPKSRKEGMALARN